MDSELLAKLQKRRKLQGQSLGSKQQKEQETKQANKVQVKQPEKSKKFQQNKKKIESMFANQMGISSPNKKQEPVKKEEIHGNSEGFKNAKALLQKNMTNAAPSAIIIEHNKQNQPQMPLNLPPPPPPPVFSPNQNHIQISNLPPPPSMELTFPPSYSNLPSVPFSLANEEQVQKSKLSPPPSLDDLPPPPPPINDAAPTPNNISKPPPPLEHKKYKIQQQMTNVPQIGPNTLNQQNNVKKPTKIIPPCLDDLPPPVLPLPVNQKPTEGEQQQKSCPQNQQIQQQQKQQKAQKIVKQQIQIDPKKIEQQQIIVEQKKEQIKNLSQQKRSQSIQNSEDNIFKVTKGTNKKPSKIYDIQQQKQNQQYMRQRNRTIQHQKVPNISLSTRIFNKDISSYLKRAFIKQADIIDNIGLCVTKKLYTFSFPSIETQTRDIEINETIYTNTKQLDVVACYMQKNLNGIKQHADAKKQFLNKLKTQDQQADPLKMRMVHQLLTDIDTGQKYLEPNFVQIKNTLNRCDNLMKIFSKDEKFQECAQIKQYKQKLYKSITNYMRQPNQDLYKAIDQQITVIRAIKI